MHTHGIPSQTADATHVPARPRKTGCRFCAPGAITTDHGRRVADGAEPRIAKSIAGYKFVALQDLPALRARFLQESTRRGLKGLVLLSPEGANLFVAGADADVDGFVAWVRTCDGLTDLHVKVSHSDDVPHALMLVKVKKQIIAFDPAAVRPDITIDPIDAPAPRVEPHTLKQWLDEGRPVTLVDTRNDYEVRMGTFVGARHAGIRHFKDFPRAVEGLAAELNADGDEAQRDRDVVLFCTGGIRCEKAAPYLRALGCKNVLQLDGGILRWFEECGDAHFRGECFVFDKRVGVDAHLRETDTVMCFVCRMPLSVQDQQSKDYVFEVSCPFCIGTRAT